VVLHPVNSSGRPSQRVATSDKRQTGVKMSQPINVASLPFTCFEMSTEVASRSSSEKASGCYKKFWEEHVSVYVARLVGAVTSN
jgi:hypothetical protein